MGDHWLGVWTPRALGGITRKISKTTQTYPKILEFYGQSGEFYGKKLPG